MQSSLHLGDFITKICYIWYFSFCACYPVYICNYYFEVPLFCRGDLYIDEYAQLTICIAIIWVFLSVALYQHGYILMVLHDFHVILKPNLSIHHWVRLIPLHCLLSTFFGLPVEILSCFNSWPLLTRARTFKALGLLTNFIAYRNTEEDKGGWELGLPSSIMPSFCCDYPNVS